jgi:shikimate dehydrogenase
MSKPDAEKTNKTRIAGVVGWPVGHSLSPTLHRAWIAAARIDADYQAFAIAPDDAASALSRLPETGLVGVNVTVPYKTVALEIAQEVNDRARRIGAANLLTVDARGHIVADNTDAFGFLDGLIRSGADVAGPAAVLGAGGAARAVVVALADAGCRDLRLVNRTPEKAGALIQLARELGVKGVIYGWADAAKALAGAHLLVNATSLGMTGETSLPSLDLSRLAEDGAVYDLVYAPRETALLTAARLQGLHAIEGLDMLIGQARPSFEAFFGRPPPETVDARALLANARSSLAPQLWPQTPP